MAFMFLQKAIIDNNLQEVKNSFDRGSSGQRDVNSSDEFGTTALMVASNLNRFKILKYLVKRGANINTINYEGISALHFARGFELIKYLVEHGANVNARANISTVLMDAASQGDFKSIKYLVKHGANINASDEDGETTLTRAALSRHTIGLAIVRYLVERGATISSTDIKWAGLRPVKEYLASVIVQKPGRAKMARTKAKAKLHLKTQQQTRRKFGGDVSSVIASFLHGEPNIKQTFTTYKKKQKKSATLAKFNARLREYARKEGVKLTTKSAGKRKYKSDPLLRVQIVSSSSNKSRNKK
jgi:hypothetical protein